MDTKEKSRAATITTNCVNIKKNPLKISRKTGLKMGKVYTRKANKRGRNLNSSHEVAQAQIGMGHFTLQFVHLQ
jgi:hypothetical protein